MLKFIIIIVVILVLALIIISIYAASFLINVALFRNNEWYHKTGHRLMNPDNFNTTRTIYDDIEDEQNKIGGEFWEKSVTKEMYLDVDKDKLYGRFFQAKEYSRKWVICVHGYRSYGKRDMAYTATRFYEQGYNVLVPDLRAHGKSTGEIIGMGWYDRLDILEWIKEVIRIDTDAEIILFGGSMGSAAVMMVSGETLPKNVIGFIADCGYTSVYDEFKALIKSALKLPSFPLVQFANIFAKRKIGFTLKEASSVKQLAKNTLPILFIHGTKDKFVPHQMIYENIEATNGVKESLLIENAPHLSSSIYEPENYYDTVFEFLNRYCFKSKVN